MCFKTKLTTKHHSEFVSSVNTDMCHSKVTLPGLKERDNYNN